MSDPAWLANYFGFELVDYRRPGDGVLISSGCGIMMAVMDAVPRLRWCIDIDGYRPLWHRLGALLAALDRNCELGLLAGVGLYHADDPSILRAALGRVINTRVECYAGPRLELGGRHRTLASFIDACNEVARQQE